MNTTTPKRPLMIPLGATLTGVFSAAELLFIISIVEMAYALGGKNGPHTQILITEIKILTPLIPVMLICWLTMLGKNWARIVLFLLCLAFWVPSLLFLNEIIHFKYNNEHWLSFTNGDHLPVFACL